MNKIQRKLKKLKALADMVTENDRRRAQKKSDFKYNFCSYRQIMIDGIDNISDRPNISIAICEINCDGHARHRSSWTDLPYDVLYDSWTEMDQMSDDFYNETREIVRLIRLASRVGMHNIKFGRYKRVIESCDYFNFEAK